MASSCNRKRVAGIASGVGAGAAFVGSMLTARSVGVVLLLASFVLTALAFVLVSLSAAEESDGAE